MSGVVEVCVKEIMKLTEKVKPKNPLVLVSNKPKGRAAAVSAAEQEEAANEMLVNETSSMSEATVCLIMDRFVPW